MREFSRIEIIDYGRQLKLHNRWKQDRIEENRSDGEDDKSGFYLHFTGGFHGRVP